MKLLVTFMTALGAALTVDALPREEGRWTSWLLAGLALVIGSALVVLQLDQVNVPNRTGLADRSTERRRAAAAFAGAELARESVLAAMDHDDLAAARAECLRRNEAIIGWVRVATRVQIVLSAVLLAGALLCLNGEASS